MSTQDVVVYGASGYTGRLVCEFLGELGVPYTAMGRDDARLRDSMNEHVPGSESHTYEVRAVEHTLDALTEAFAGAKVICNMVGPFSKLGHETLQAAIAVGAHYIDTTGEQDWVIDCDEQYGAQAAAKGLLVSPGIAQMYTIGEIAAQIALEQDGLDTLDILVMWKGMPTIASTRTILVNAATSKAFYLENGELLEWPPERGVYDVVVPGHHQMGLALPWGGTSHPIWFRNDPRVRTAKALGGLFNEALMRGVPAIVEQALEATATMDDETRYSALSDTAAQVNNEFPPREDPSINISLDSVQASGPGGRAHVVIHGNCNYQQTGLMQAYAAQRLLAGPPNKVGFASACEAFGHNELLGVLRDHGLVHEPIVSRTS